MEKINRWIAKHQTASRLIMTLLWVAVAIWWISLEIPTWFTVLFVFVAVFVYSVNISAAGDRLLKKPMEILKTQCDPYPLLEEAKEQRNYPANDAMKQVREINYALGLRHVGQYEQAYALLRAINIDKNAGMLPVAKAAYYNNLMDLCTLMGKHAESVIWYEKLMQIFSDMKPGKQKQMLQRGVDANRADYHFCKGEYEQALRALSTVKPENLSERVENAMMYARVYLALGETEKAVKPLTFVAENGNKLYFATEARDLLAKITTVEEP